MAEKSDDAVACQLENTTVYIDAQVALGEKCVRCWHKQENVGANKQYEELCSRCVENIDGDGESRTYA
jgi:isoleucyl-tRNA synthetase